MAIASIASAQTPQAKQFQIRVEAKKEDQELSPATLQQIRARQVVAQQQQPSSEYYSEEDEEEDNIPAQQTFHRPAATQQRQYQPQHHQQQQQQQVKKVLTKKQREQYEQELEQEEEEEPDHLALLLEKSKFSCNDRNTGYYADDTVDCQVFHYCQESTKHSWICPEGECLSLQRFCYVSLFVDWINSLLFVKASLLLCQLLKLWGSIFERNSLNTKLEFVPKNLYLFKFK